jgi:hypothetical protein
VLPEADVPVNCTTRRCRPWGGAPHNIRLPCLAAPVVYTGAVPSYTLFELDVLPFVVIPVCLAAALAWGIAAASRQMGEASAATGRAWIALVAAILWMSATWIAASSGVLRRWEATPPPFALLVLAIVTLGFAIAFSRCGRLLATGLPLWTLVAVQGFRLPLELAMHALYGRGFVPVQMSYSGRNFDVLTGASALIVAGLVRADRAPRWLVATWNVFGIALLTNVVAIAILSTPRIHYFGVDRLNVWVTYPPFVWLPAVMVLAAFAGHLVIFRALRSRRVASGGADGSTGAPSATPNPTRSDRPRTASSWPKRTTDTGLRSFSSALSVHY